MRLAVVSHSLVNRRQSQFFDWLGTRGVDVMQIAPDRWGQAYPSYGKGYPTINDGDMANYEYLDEAFLALDRFGPDVLYVQQEPYCKTAAQFIRVAKRSGVKFVLFTWDNINDYYDDPFAKNVLKDSDLVVCGSLEAARLVRPINANVLQCVQVGVNTDLFVPLGESDVDVIFQGRMHEEKGFRVLEKAATGRFGVLWPEPNQGTPYADMPARYNRAKVLAAPSIDRPAWHEQHAGYATLEALSCGLYVVTSDSASIVSSLIGCPGVRYAPQRDHEALGSQVDDLIRFHHQWGKNVPGRRWVEANYGYTAVANKLVPALEALR